MAEPARVGRGSEYLRVHRHDAVTARELLLWQLTAVRAVSGAPSMKTPFVRVTYKLNRHSGWSGSRGSQGKHQHQRPL